MKIIKAALLIVVLLAAGCTSKVSTQAVAPPYSRAITQGLTRIHDPGHVTGTIKGPCYSRSNGQLPDTKCTPGAIDPSVTQADIHQTICVSGYTASVRPPSSETESFKMHIAAVVYGLSPHIRGELDHLVPLELGGANDALNLWIEVGAIPNPKDSVEDELHREVCAGKISLATAQDAIAGNWETARKG